MTTLLGYLREGYLPSRPTMRPASAEQLLLAVRGLEAFAGRSLVLRRLQERFLARHLVDLATRCSEATVNSRRRAILTIWRAAARQGLARRPKLDHVPALREPWRLPRAWTVDEMRRLLAFCRGLSGQVGGIPSATYWSSLILAAYSTGARIGALRAVATGECNLAGGWIILRAESQKNRRDHLVWLSAEAQAAIADHYDPNRSLVWPWPHCRRHFFRLFRRIVMAAGLSPDCGLFHRIRRTTVSYLARQSLDLARRVAGHSRPEVTVAHYVDPTIAEAGLRPAALLPLLESARRCCVSPAGLDSGS